MKEHLDIIRGLLMVPERTKALTAELHRLNDNLDKFNSTLLLIPKVLEEVSDLTETLEDLKTMAAPLLGFRIVENKSDSTRGRP